MRITSRAAFFTLVVARQQPAGAAEHVDHVRASLIEDELQNRAAYPSVSAAQ
jgi:hypothetical protein